MVYYTNNEKRECVCIMNELKRLDGHGCGEGCYNYRTFNGVHYCHAKPDVVTIKVDHIYFCYKIIGDTSIVPSWCQLGRG